jgi:hypothetical protein
MPLPRTRSVAARCPRASGHKNGDRKPSLILWMNRDGVTGGALCPVCMEESGGRAAGGAGALLRNRTWRVRYVEDNRALLSAPRRRACVKPARQASAAARTLPDREDDAGHRAPAPIPRAGRRRTAEIAEDGVESGLEPVGGHVLRDVSRAAQVGSLPTLAYVLAKLKVMGGTGSFDDAGAFGDDGAQLGDGVRLRTIGTMSHRHCPLKVMMWSDKCSKGPNVRRRVSDLAWYAAQSVGTHGGDESLGGDGGGAQSDGDASTWLPTDVLSVSAMRPSGWREIKTASGQPVSVPAGWMPSAQQWIMFDLDQVEGLSPPPPPASADDAAGDVVSRAATAMIRVVRRSTELSGVCMVLRSGPRGLHIWAELREVRENPRGWFSCGTTRAWYAQTGARLLKAARRAGATSGIVDMSGCAAGRFARRPGWRILPDTGEPFRSRVVTIATARVRNRDPRGG